MTPAIAWLPTDERVAKFEACFPADSQTVFHKKGIHLLELQYRGQRLRVHWK